MGECGCSMGHERYTLPGPGKSFYVITLAGHCTYCDAPSGLTIEEIRSDHVLYREYKRGEFVKGPLPLEEWPDGMGVAIIAGMRKHEFVNAMSSHLVGISSDALGENGRIDEAGADVIVEEMYSDAQFAPRIVQPMGATDAQS